MSDDENLKVRAEQCAAAPRPISAHGATLSGEAVLCLQVKYSSLPNYEDREEEFNAEAVLLRRRFTHKGQH